MQDLTIETWPDQRLDALEKDLDNLAGLLHAVVHDGASVSFILPFTFAEARAFWCKRVLPGAKEGNRYVLVARLSGEIVGTVQLDLNTPPNQTHRAEVSKLLVQPTARNRGIARRLMGEIEEAARARGRTLLTLDTRRGDRAEPLYRSLGYQVAGVIPGYARGPLSPDLEDTTIMYKKVT